MYIYKSLHQGTSIAPELLSELQITDLGGSRVKRLHASEEDIPSNSLIYHFHSFSSCFETDQTTPSTCRGTARPPVYLSQQRSAATGERFQALAPVAVCAFLEAREGKVC